MVPRLSSASLQWSPHLEQCLQWWALDMGNPAIRPDHFELPQIGGFAEPEVDAGGEAGQVAAAETHLPI